MPGERDLNTLRRSMRPTLRPGRFVFCCFHDFTVPEGVRPIALFEEAEGLTAIVTEQEALAGGLAWEFPARLITLAVHSDLQAVGFLAGVLAALAAARVPCNVVSGYFHDHLFVPADRVDVALQALEDHAADASTAPTT